MLDGGVVLGEQHDRAALVAAGDDDVFEHVARVRFGVDDDQVRRQLGDALGQVHVGRQRGDQVVAGFEQADTQGVAAPDLGGQRGVILLAGSATVVATTMRSLGGTGWGDFMPHGRKIRAGAMPAGQLRPAMRALRSRSSLVM